MARPPHESDTRLRAARVARGLTLREAADLTGVSRSVLQSWEARAFDHSPRTDHALRVAEVMGLDMEDLFHDFEIQRVPREEGAVIA